MAAQENFEEPQMENSSRLPQEKELSINVADKAMETVNLEVEDKKEESNQETKEIAVVEEKIVDDKEEIGATSPTGIQRSNSFREESDFLSDLKEYEKKALFELRSKIEEAILNNKIFEEKKDKDKEKETEKKEETAEEKEVASATSIEGNAEEKEIKEEQVEKKEEEEEEKNNNKEKGEEVEVEFVEAAEQQYVNKDIAIWGVPLLPSKGDNRTDVLLLKFLRAREFKVSDAFEMLRNILKWRKENKIDSILEEDIDADVGSMTCLAGRDRNGHPICFNSFAFLGNDELYGKAFEKKREKLLRCRIQLMEKSIQMLDFNPGSASAILQVNDLKNTPLPTKKELRMSIKKTVDLLQDNYPEFVAKNIFINVPFWYYAYSALFSPSLSQRSKNKLVYARTARVTDTLLKYITASQIPEKYGGLKCENDTEFSVEDEAKEAIVKAGSEETIEIDATEAGNTLIWDVTVSGWEVNYKEEFVPTDEGSYTIIVQKGKKMISQEGIIRNTFTVKEPGKIVITIENGAFKKKRVLYRYKIKNSAPSSSSS